MAYEFIKWWFTVVKKIAFIVEGATEKILIESEQFKNWIRPFNLELVDHIINAEGGGNLLPHKINDMIKTLKNKGADHIFILTDLEREPTISTVKNRLNHSDVADSFITVIALESWFLACSSAFGKWLKKDCIFFIEDPENTSLEKPFERIKAIGMQEKKQGCRNKIILAQDMINKHGFSFEEIMAHPNCTSIKYIEKVLKSLNP